MKSAANDQKPQSVKETLLEQVRPTKTRLILPALHLIFCVVVELAFRDDWKWFFPFLVDLPFSIIFGQFSFLGAFLALAIFGTLWWYVIGVFLKWISGVGASIANR